MNDRRILSEDGVLIAVVTIDRKKKKVVAAPKIDSRGFVYVKTSRDLMHEAGELVQNTVADGIKNTKEFDWGNLKNSVRDVLGKYLYEQTRRKPVILPVIMEANQNGRQRKKPKSAHADNQPNQGNAPTPAVNVNQPAQTGDGEAKKKRRPRRRKPKNPATVAPVATQEN